MGSEDKALMTCVGIGYRNLNKTVLQIDFHLKQPVVYTDFINFHCQVAPNKFQSQIFVLQLFFSTPLLFLIETFQELTFLDQEFLRVLFCCCITLHFFQLYLLLITNYRDQYIEFSSIPLMDDKYSRTFTSFSKVGHREVKQIDLRSRLTKIDFRGRVCSDQDDIRGWSATKLPRYMATCWCLFLLKCIVKFMRKC